VNIVPADVRMETYVRGKNLDAVLNVNRAIRGGVEITEIPGYLPLKQDFFMGELFKENVQTLV